MSKKLTKIVSEQDIISNIFFLRGQKVMLNVHLSTLYGVETKQLKRSVRRNIERFPGDFMFVLDQKELENLRSQNGTSRWGGSRYLPITYLKELLNLPSQPTRKIGFKGKDDNYSKLY